MSYFSGAEYNSIDDCTKDGGEEVLPRCIAFKLQIFNDSIGDRLKSAVHVGKKIHRRHL